MARGALPALELDDPLRSRSTSSTAAAGSNQGNAQTTAAPAGAPTRAGRDATAKTELSELGQTALRGPWRAWGTGNRTATYRLPEDLLGELDARVRRLDLPLGLTVAAAVLRLLDDEDEAIIADVERVDDARRVAQRSARRRTA